MVSDGVFVLMLLVLVVVVGTGTAMVVVSGDFGGDAGNMNSDGGGEGGC